MPNSALSFVRTLIVLQTLIAIWFVFSPDLLPETIKEAERQLEYPAPFLDGVVVWLSYIQTALCLFLWHPVRTLSVAYFFVTVAIAGAGAFGGPALLSAVDALLGYAQVLASGAMLGILWTYGYLLLPPSEN